MLQIIQRPYALYTHTHAHTDTQMHDVVNFCAVASIWSHFRVLVAADEHGHVGMMQNAVADTAQERAAELPLPSAANHDKARPHRLCIFNDLMPSIMTVRVRELRVLDLQKYIENI